MGFRGLVVPIHHPVLGTVLIVVTDPNDEPQKPALNILNTNLTGSLYTFKLAVHYFRKQPDTEKRDRCFIITGSLNGGWVDSPVSFAAESGEKLQRGS